MLDWKEYNYLIKSLMTNTHNKKGFYMKKIILALALFTSTLAFSQNRRVLHTQQTPSTYSSPISSYSHSENEITGQLGFMNGAANIGVDYAKMADNMGFGGYFLLQTEKKPYVTQVMSFGGLLKFNIADNQKFSAAMAPGFGLHMFKDVGTSDETAFGLVFKILAQYKMTPDFSLGIESTTLTNMFSEKAPSHGQIYSIAGSFKF
jgi:hypothetical protein